MSAPIVRVAVAAVLILTSACSEVAAGSSYVDSQIVASVLAPRVNQQLDVLTARELEILGLIAEGRSNAAIAAATHISKRGVERNPALG